MITPAWNGSGDSTETSAPAAVKLTIRLIRLPTTLEPARIIWLEATMAGVDDFRTRIRRQFAKRRPKG